MAKVIEAGPEQPVHQNSLSPYISIHTNLVPIVYYNNCSTVTGRYSCYFALFLFGQPVSCNILPLAIKTLMDIIEKFHRNLIYVGLPQARPVCIAAFLHNTASGNNSLTMLLIYLYREIPQEVWQHYGNGCPLHETNRRYDEVSYIRMSNFLLSASQCIVP